MTEPMGYVVVERDPSNGEEALSSTILHPNPEDGDWERDVRSLDSAPDRYTVAAVVAESALPLAKPCGCKAACDHLPYDRLAEANENLGKALDAQVDIMRDAVSAAVADGPAAGMNVLVRHVRSVPELAAGLEFSEDMPGGDR